MNQAQDFFPLIRTLPILEKLKIAADLEIAFLGQQRAKLSGISTDLQQLIAAYNAQKSLLGHAAHWYGEQIWWLKIIVSIVAAGIAILLYIPCIISMALSLTISFLLLDHHAVATVRDRLITEDLVAQNNSVQEMLGLLNGTRENLEKGLAVLCQMNQEMGVENLRLRDNVDSVTRQVNGYKAINVSLNQTIKTLQENEEHLNLQLTTLSEQLAQYEKLVASGSYSFAADSQKFKEATASLEADSKQLKTVTNQLSHHLNQTVRDLTSSPYISQEDIGTTNAEITSALRDSKELQKTIDGLDFDSTNNHFSLLESQTNRASPQRVTKSGNY